MESSPPSLLEQLHGDHATAAWDRFVDLYTPLLYFWACRMRLQADDAADLVQEVFTTLLEKLPQYRPEPGGSFRAWLRTLTLNKWQDMRRRKAAALRPGTVGGLDEVPIPDPAEALWEAEYQQHVVGRAIDVMHTDFQPATWQACLALVVDGKPAAQVARETGLTVEAVYAAKARVLRRLRQELAGLLE